MNVPSSPHTHSVYRKSVGKPIRWQEGGKIFRRLACRPSRLSVVDAEDRLTCPVHACAMEVIAAVTVAVVSASQTRCISLSEGLAAISFSRKRQTKAPMRAVSRKAAMALIFASAEFA